MAADLGLNAKHALTVLTRLAHRRDEEKGLLERALSGEGRLDALAAVAIEVAIETGDPIGVVLAVCVRATPDPSRARRLEELLPAPGRTVALREVAAIVTGQLLDGAGAVAGASGTQDEVDRLTNNLAGRLRDLGRFEEALAAAEEAVTIHRAQVGSRRDVVVPALVMFLNTLANHLRGLGRSEEALAADQEAVTHCRVLASARPDIVLPHLAASLNELANDLSFLGRYTEALAAAEEAVTIRRTLAEARPDAFDPELADSLSNLAVALTSLGRREEALAADREVVTIRRALASARPDAFEPDLAMSLINLAVDLSFLGWRQEALAAAQEAVARCRTLAGARPTAFGHNLAASLTTLAYCLRDLGRQEEVLAPNKEAVAIRRALPGANPTDLAMSLNNLAVHLRELGRWEEALGAAEEGVEVMNRVPHSLSPASGRPMSMICATYGRLCLEHGRPPRADLLTLLEAVLGKGKSDVRAAAMPAPDIPMPHPAADPNRAQRLNFEYLERKRQWDQLPWLKRLVTKPPVPPTAI